ncbi:MULTISPECIES: DUF6686 family protein [Flammeovirga]|uniref:Uncharacterized protein n=1 Tax=Flammeovirga agarivorans TaxID=2726742 RepID=A0A7X8XTX8_9BACT|nr:MULTISPECIES: DUF6686 family protein [Flammeovirga]NLR89837.1 hypothetical protein [Flammeovirga agarivorans]
MCRTKDLYYDEDLMISQCIDCKRIGLQLNNILMNFTVKEFKKYTHKLSIVKFDENAYDFEGESPKIILKTDDKKINYCLDYQEFDQLRTGCQMSMLMLDTEEILSQI